MNLIWILLVAVGVIALFFMGGRIVTGGRGRAQEPQRAPEGRGGRDLGANVNPSQSGNEVDRFPDRTGAQTRSELGARNPVDVTFTGDQPPTQWHPANHGVSGDHMRDGEHRSATAPTETGADSPRTDRP